MPGERVRRILRSKSRLSDEEIASMSDGEGWAWLHKNSPPKIIKDKRESICFTGFHLDEKDELAALAEVAGFRVVTGVSQTLGLLCTGDDPGPRKLEKASEWDIPVVNHEAFIQFAETGEWPPGED